MHYTGYAICGLLFFSLLLLRLVYKPEVSQAKEPKEEVIDQNEISLKLEAQAPSIEFVQKQGRPENFLGVRDLSSVDA